MLFRSARTLQIKIRYSDFSTFTRSRTLESPTSVDSDLSVTVRELFHANWTGKTIRLLGVYAQSLVANEGQGNLLDAPKQDSWRKALAAVDRVRGKYGDSIVGLAAGMNAGFRARVHENPENLPGKEPTKRS